MTPEQFYFRSLLQPTAALSRQGIPLSSRAVLLR